MKFDPSFLRYLTKDEFRILTAVEIGQKNHEIVPIPLITSISNLRHGGVTKFLNNLLRHKLLHHETKYFEGYRLTNLGYDYLALRSLYNRKKITGVGSQIGVGKESDIFMVSNISQEVEPELDEEHENVSSEEICCLKVHRLGRTSFRNIKNKRDYHKHRKSPSWLYLSRLAAQREFEFMQALYKKGYPIPKPIDQNRHMVLMSLVDGKNLLNVRSLKDVKKAYDTLMALIVRFCKDGLIHGDFNEFNLMMNAEEVITVIDFPQMVSVDHFNAKMYFERDVICIRKFFEKRFGYVSDEYPGFEETFVQRTGNLDVELRASGYLSLEASANLKKAHLSGLEGHLESMIIKDANHDFNETAGPTATVNDVLDKEIVKKEESIKRNMDDLRKIVRSEIRRNISGGKQKKAMKISRNHVKAKNRKNARVMAYQ